MTAPDRVERALSRHGYPTGSLPFLGDGVTRQVSYLEAYSELVAVSLARARFLGELIAATVERARDNSDDGSPEDALVYEQHTMQRIGFGEDAELEAVPIGEDVRALVKLEQDERKIAAGLIRDALKIGVQIHQTEAMRSYGATIAAVLQEMVRELGLDEHSPLVNRAAARAVYAGRRAVGQDEGNPDERVGPPLSAAEREQVLARRAG